jgi:multidrug efflux pump
MSTPQEFNNMIIFQKGEQIVRFSDVGRAELGPEDIRGIMKRDGVPTVGTAIVPQPGSNHIEIVDEVYRRLEIMKHDLPDDVRLDIGFDNTQFIRSSITEVKNTIYIAFLLVVLVIFFFLRDWRSTLIPILVIPVSLIGTFFIMYLAGFTINVLTLLAIVLAIGLVVDDAIVMMENIFVKIEQGIPPVQAGLEGSKEIFFAVIATTITLIAVFFPIVFMEGMTGKLFREFSIVISGAVAISSFVALSLTPMLSTKLLRVSNKKRGRFYNSTEKFFVRLNDSYKNSLERFIAKRRIALIIIGAALGLITLFWWLVPSEMAPLEDRSRVNLNISTAEGATYEYSLDYIEDLTEMVNTSIPASERKGVLAMTRGSGGMIFLMLVPPNERERTQNEIANQLTAESKKKTKAMARVMQQSTFGGRRSGMPVQFVIQATSIDKLREILPEFMDKVNSNPAFQMADVNLKFTRPEIRINLHRDKAAIMGVSTQNIRQDRQDVPQ